MKKIFLVIIFTILTLYSCSYYDFREVKGTLEYVDDVNEESEETEEMVEEVEETTGTLENISTESEILKKENNKNIVIEDIMPFYKKTLYARAFLMQFNEDDLFEAYIDLQNRMQEENYNNVESSIVKLNYNAIESAIQNDYKYIVERYNLLEETNYLGDIKNFIKGKKEEVENYSNNGSIATDTYSLVINLESLNKKTRYYEFDATILEPVVIPKNTVETLEEGDKIMIKYPMDVEDKNNKEEANTMMIYDGGLGFTYSKEKRGEVISESDIDCENYLVSLNDDYYVFCEGENVKAECKKLDTKVRVLIDGRVGKGRNIQNLATATMNYKNGEGDEKLLYDNIEVFDTYESEKENTFFEKDKTFYANYITFDRKGYIIDMFHLIND